MPTPKKILLVTRPIAPPWDEASKNFAYALARDLRLNTDLELHLMTNGFVSQLPIEVIQEQIYTHSQNDFSFSQKIRLFWFLLCNSHKFDIIHLLFTPTKLNIFFLKLTLLFSKAKTAQTVATLREDIFSNDEIKKLMFADIIITYSDYAKNKLLALGLENSQRIYPGIDLEEYCKKEKKPELLAQCNFTTDDFIINFSGEYTRLGAMDDVIDSFIEVAAQIPSAKLSLAVRVKNERDAKRKEEVIAKLQKNNVLARVAFHDDLQYAMTDIYNLADISIFPVQNMHGKFDVPLVVVEAMACEKAVIVSDLPILKEFTSEKNSITITKGHVLELTAAIVDLYENPEKRDSIGKNGRIFCEENFDIKKVSAAYEQLYKKL